MMVGVGYRWLEPVDLWLTRGRYPNRLSEYRKWIPITPLASILLKEMLCRADQ
jgi:hypothetical protein